MVDPFEVANGCLNVILNDIEDVVDGVLLPICATYGVALSNDLSTKIPTEFEHLALYERADVAEGLTFEFLADPVQRVSMLYPGPIPQQNYSVLIRVIYRDPSTAANKLSETPQNRLQFLSAITTAVVGLLDPREIAPNGAWTLPSNDVLLSPQINEVDTMAEEIERHQVYHCTENTLTGFTLG